MEAVPSLPQEKLSQYRSFHIFDSSSSNQHSIKTVTLSAVYNPRDPNDPTKYKQIEVTGAAENELLLYQKLYQEIEYYALTEEVTLPPYQPKKKIDPYSLSSAAAKESYRKLEESRYQEMVREMAIACQTVVGQQSKMGGRIYYSLVIPFGLFPSLFVYDDDIAPEERGQRELNPRRAAAISAYIRSNPDTWVLPSLLAFSERRIEAEPLITSPNKNSCNQIVRLSLSEEDDIKLCDGQHRWKAICMALERDRSLRFQTASVLLFPETEVKEAKQIFVDLNSNLVKPSKSICINFDGSDEMALITKKVSNAVKVIKAHLDEQNLTVKRRSNKLFTLNSLNEANKLLLSKLVTKEKDRIAIAYWKSVASCLTDWQQIENKELSPLEVKDSSISTSGLAIAALGRLGADLIFSLKSPRSCTEENFTERLRPLSKLDWSRSNEDWQTLDLFTKTGGLNKKAASVKNLSQYLLEFLVRSR